MNDVEKALDAGRQAFQTTGRWEDGLRAFLKAMPNKFVIDEVTVKGVVHGAITVDWALSALAAAVEREVRG